MLQATYRRSRPLFAPENIMVVTNEDYVHLVKEQLPELPEANILSEPSRKNTAPCIAYAAYKIRQRDKDAVMLVASSDQLITREEEFRRIIGAGLKYAAEEKCLITLGIKPSRPDTGYGYIQFATNDNSSADIKKVKTFTEKPTAEMAQQFIQSGEFLWNSGMFLWKVSVFLDAFAKYMPEENALFAEQAEAFDTPGEEKAVQLIYGEVRNISVDYGIMEKADNVKVLIADFGWSDLGTWGSLFEQIRPVKEPNAIVGNNVLHYDSRNNIVHMPKDKLVVIQGLNGYIVAESENVLLICKMEDEQKIKNLVNEVRIEKGDQFL
jgi:mannose-1-phosphate guanylyltransferase